MEIRKADIHSLEEILEIYKNARTFMAENGNPAQWGNTYPSEETIRRDIAQGKCHLCMENKKILCVFYFAVETEPNYLEITDGNWLNDKPYGVVHRIASAGGVKGAATYCLNWAFEQSGGNLRIDTHDDNLPMQNLLGKLGFTRCGRVTVEDGTPRIAYQKC